MNSFRLNRRDGFVCIALALLTLAIYGRMTSAGWVNYDDNRYVTANPYIQYGLHRQTVGWAFVTGYADNWHPLTWISHALDVRLYGMNPAKHHQTNVLIHIFNTLLLFVWLRKLSGAFWRCVIVAALFAWHPVHVESVAWVAERKDVLSGFFWMLSLLAYTRYARKPGIVRYQLTLFLFALGLLAKPMVVTLPFVFLLLDFWPLKRVKTNEAVSPETSITPEISAHQKSFSALVVEKIPFFALSALCSYITYIVQAAGGTTKAIHASLGLRFANALIAYCGYLGKTFWPARLAVFYPYDLSPPIWKIILAILVIGGITVATIACRRSRPYLLFGWLFFLGTLVPTIGIIQVGEQSLADRYIYLPAMGIFIGVVWLAADFCLAQKSKQAPLMVAAIVLAILAALTVVQEGYWQNARTLFGHALDVTEHNSVAQFNYGSALMAERAPAEALPHFIETLKLNPKHYPAMESIGSCYLIQGKNLEAADYFDQAIKVRPDDWVAYMKRGVAREQMKNMPGALSDYQEALRLQPGSPEVHYVLGSAYLSENQVTNAVNELREAIRLNPNLGLAYAKLASALDLSGNSMEAVTEYEIALKFNPNDTTALNNLAWTRAANADPQLRDGKQAVELAQHLCGLTQNAQPYFIGTLAAAYAEAGRFADAVAAAQKAHDLAVTGNLPEIAAKNAELVKLYQSGQPYHEVMKTFGGKTN